jgi:hypothetical protein
VEGLLSVTGLLLLLLDPGPGNRPLPGQQRGGNVYTNPCQAPGNAYQDWYWSAGNTSGYSKFTDVATSRPLWGTPEYSIGTYDQPPYNNWKLI